MHLQAATKPPARKELPEDETLVVLEKVDEEVDRGVDDSEEVGEVGGVLGGGNHSHNTACYAGFPIEGG